MWSEDGRYSALNESDRRVNKKSYFDTAVRSVMSENMF